MARVEVKSADSPQHIDMERLKGKTVPELDEIYREADTPELTELDGRYEGTVLAGDFFPLSSSVTVDIANLPINVWGGKNVEVLSDERARGTNRFELGVTETTASPFEGRIVPALYGDDDCYVFDYDIPENTAPIRRVRDEVKKIRRGLYLGRIYFRTNDDYRFLAYFGLEKG